MSVEMFDYMDDILNLQHAGNKLLLNLCFMLYLTCFILFKIKIFHVLLSAFIELFKITVFGSLDMSRSNSMTPCGQCRLAPLIPCIQDASQLYDCCVKILFKLHGALPADTLAGHRDRFSKQFHELKSFYNTIKHMQYFKHLITIPSLPEVILLSIINITDINIPEFVVSYDMKFLCIFEYFRTHLTF